MFVIEKHKLVHTVFTNISDQQFQQMTTPNYIHIVAYVKIYKRMLNDRSWRNHFIYARYDG